MTTHEALTTDSSIEQIRIVFWNVNKKSLDRHVCALAKATQADVIILLENGDDPEPMLEALQNNVSKAFRSHASVGEQRFHCFCRTPHLGLDEFHFKSRMSFRHLKLKTVDAALVLVHGPDIRNYGEGLRNHFPQQVVSEMKWDKCGHKGPFIIMGDFNVNPFDEGVWAPTTFNAMSTKTCVARGERVYLGESYPLYYNPMWGFLGDRHSEPPGTTYNKSNLGVYGWSVFDQCILHGSLVPLFRRVDIVSEAGPISLADRRGRPDDVNASDHFPIMLTLEGNTNG